MKREYNKFLKLLKQNKEEAVLFVLELLETKNINVKDVYFNILIPAMKQLRKDEEITIWEKALLESRLKTVIECTYPFIIKNKQKDLNKKVLIVIPEGEEEHVGALVSSNLFEFAGFEVVYIDSAINTNDVLIALNKYKPHYLTIGLKKFYNAFETQELIAKVIKEHKDITVVVGGPVFNLEQVKNSLTHHYFVKDYNEIFEIAKEVQNEASTKNSK